MARSTEGEVLDILDGSELREDEVRPFLVAANLFVTARLGSSGLSTTLLREIERWVCAHFIAAREKQVKSESIGGVSQTYQMGSGAAGLSTTMYGERALLLDSTGLLSQAGLRQVVFGAVDYGVAHEPD